MLSLCPGLYSSFFLTPAVNPCMVVSQTLENLEQEQLLGNDQPYVCQAHPFPQHQGHQGQHCGVHQLLLSPETHPLWGPSLC